MESQAVVSTTTSSSEGGASKVKTIGLIAFLIILIAGVGVGVVLVQRQQDIREKASSGSACQHAPDCDLVDNAPNQGSYTAPGNITFVDVTDQDEHRYFPGNTNDGCREITIVGQSVTWNRYESGPNCKDVSNVQVWFTQSTSTATATSTATSTATATATSTSSTPPITAQCLDIKVYNTDWIRIPASDFDEIKPGDTIRVAVEGNATGGSITKAKFKINGTQRAEVTGKKPGANEFFDEYKIPLGSVSLSVEAQVFHSTLGWF